MREPNAPEELNASGLAPIVPLHGENGPSPQELGALGRFPRVDEPRALAELALAGDTTAWGLLIQRHNHRVVVSLLARGVRIDRAKDIAQDAWLRLIEQQRAGRLNQISLPGLAIAQAAFLACEAARKDASARRLVPIAEGDGEPARDVADPAADAETRLLGSERLACAENVLARSSASARTVFRLAYGKDPMAHVDIAREAGLSLQRVRQILCEVRKELRIALEIEGTEGAARG
jgi:RNA polymerase sigma-70 factor (ECF subfamily)